MDLILKLEENKAFQNLLKDEEFQELLKANSSMVTDGTDKYFFLPFWFRLSEPPDVLTAYELGKLPPLLVNILKYHRII